MKPATIKIIGFSLVILMLSLIYLLSRSPDLPTRSIYIEGRVNTPDEGLKGAMSALAKHVASHQQEKNVVCVKWYAKKGVGAEELTLSYAPVSQRLRYFYSRGKRLYYAYNVSLTDIRKAAQSGGAFRNFAQFKSCASEIGACDDD